MRDFVIPRDTSSSVREAFRQVRLILRDQSVPVLTHLDEVRGIAEGSSAYLWEGGRVRKYVKLGNALYFEELTKQN